MTLTIQNSASEFLIYLRKSRADLALEQQTQTDVLARHRVTLLDLAAAWQLPVGDIYQEVVSGDTIAARPQMRRLLAEVEAGCWAGVLVMEVERLARGDTMDQGYVAQAFKLSHTLIVTPAKVYDPNNEFDQEYFEFGLFMSRREYQAIKRRLQRGRAASVREGKYVGSRAPYGYHRVKLPGEKGFTLSPLPAEAETVKNIFHWYLFGLPQPDGTLQPAGISRIAQELNSRLIPAANGGSWSPASVRGILGNPHYDGQVVWGRRPVQCSMQDGSIQHHRPLLPPEQQTVTEGRHPPLVEHQLFLQAQQQLHRHSHAPVPTPHQTQNPLAGLLFCGHCGRSMVRRPYRKKGAPAGLLCPLSGCPTVGSELDLVEKALLEALCSWLGELWLSFPSEQPFSAQAGQMRSLERQLALVRHQLDSQADLLEQGVYTPQQYLQRKSILNRRQQTLLLEMQQLTPLPQPELPPPEPCLFPEVYAALSPAHQNEMLKCLLSHVSYHKEEKGGGGRPNDLFTLRIYPRIAPER